MTETSTRRPSFNPLAGHPGSPTCRIGTVRLTKPQTFRRNAETASWFKDIEVPAGTEADLTFNGYSVFAKCEGIKGASNFTSRIGAYYGRPKIDEGKGDPDTYTLQTY